MSLGHLHSSHEEADTKILLHARDAARREFESLDIQSPDTDVLVLTIRRLPVLPPQTNFITGTGPSRRIIPLEPIYSKLGEHTAAALPGFHAFTGADQTGRFAGKGKLMCLKTFQALPDYIKDAFVKLRKTDHPSQETEDRLDEFVCRL